MRQKDITSINRATSTRDTWKNQPVGTKGWQGGGGGGSYTEIYYEAAIITILGGQDLGIGTPSGVFGIKKVTGLCVPTVYPQMPGKSSGFVNSETITAGGSGYTAGDFVYVNVDNSGTGGSGAAFSVTISGGVVSNITRTNAGSGYTTAPTLTIGTYGSGSGASAACTVSNNEIIAIAVMTVGDGYLTTPAVTITGAGSDATASAVVVARKVVAIAVTNMGSGYTTATITIAPPINGGTQATASAIIGDIEGTVDIDDNAAFSDGIGYGIVAQAFFNSANPLINNHHLVAHDSRSFLPYALVAGNNILTFSSDYCRLSTEDAAARGCIPVYLVQGATV